MSTWLFQLDFQQGGGWEDVTTYVDYNSWHGKTATLWNNLKPVAAICNFHIKPTAALALKFINYNEPIKVYIKKDGSDYFLGYVRKDAKIQITSKLDAIMIECIDRFYALQKKIFSSFMWENYKICDPADISHSIVHQLLILAGLTTSDVANITISEVIDYFVVEENMKEVPGNSKRYIKGEAYFRFVDRNVSIGIGGDTYLNVITNLLFDFGYTFYFSASGKLTPYNFLPADTSNANYFSNTAVTKNILGMLNIIKKDSDFEGVDVRWYSVKSLPDPGLEKPILYQDITNPAANYKCMIELSAGEHYPGGADDDAVYIDFEIEGAEIVACDNVVLNLTYSGTVTTNTFTYSGRRAKVDLENTGAGTAYIKRFDITGTAIIKDQDHIAKCRLVVDTEKVVEFKSEYIRDVNDANKLASGLSRYYIYGNRQFSLISMENFNIGDFVTIDDDLILPYTQICVVIQKRFDEVTGEHEYVCESIEDYSLEIVTHDRIHRMPRAALPNTQGFADNFLLLSTAIGAILTYSGTDPSSPAEGDRRMRLLAGELYCEEYTGGSWSTMNGFKLAASMAALSLAMGCGIFNPNNDDPDTEPFPGKDFRVFNFENNYEDQNGVDDWDTKSNLAFSNTVKKFDSYSLFATAGDEGDIATHGVWGTVGESQSAGCWFYFDDWDENSSRTILQYFNANNHIIIEINDAGGGVAKLKLYLYKNSTLNILLGDDEISGGVWHYASLSYNKLTDTVYCTFDNHIYIDDSLSGSWSAGNYGLYLRPENNTEMKLYIDEACFAPDQFVDPSIWVQHYNHGLPWDVNYSQQDIANLPGPLGRCYLGGPVKINDSAWYTDETLGILHLYKAANRSTSYDLTDSSVSTSWETADFSSMFDNPQNITALYVLMDINYSSALAPKENMLLLLREYGSSETDTIATRMMGMAAAQNIADLVRLRIPMIVLAPKGKFDYREYSTDYPIDEVNVLVLGYYTNG